jgi:HD-GYP domain-containing protein (c-di-GMP phosphodiesterase class II)
MPDETVLSSAALDTALLAFADYADVKSPFRLGHSRGVAEVAAAAAAHLGLPGDDVDLVRRAGLVHDLGLIGVSSGILDKPGPLTANERERLHTHPFLTARTLARVPALAPVGRLALLHHERLDGSGYPAGVTGDALSMTARVLAAADVFRALGEPKPHRPALADDERTTLLHDEVSAGRLDGDAVTAVLVAAGQVPRRDVERPAGLTAREVEVLVLLARGMTKKAIAHQLRISPKTVNAHVEHVYGKLGVSTRGAASIFALRHGLLGQ